MIVGGVSKCSGDIRCSGDLWKCSKNFLLTSDIYVVICTHVSNFRSCYMKLKLHSFLASQNRFSGIL